MPGVRPEGNVGLGVSDTGHLIHCAGDHVTQLFVAAYADHRYQVELTGHGIDLAHRGDLRDRLRGFRDACHICLDQNDCGDHGSSVPPLSSPLAAGCGGRPLWPLRPGQGARLGRRLSPWRRGAPGGTAQCWRRNTSASVASRQSGTSSGPSRRRARTAVSSTATGGQRMRFAAQAAVRKPRSNGALCATSTQSLAKARNAGRAGPSQRRVADHVIGDAGQRGDVGRDRGSPAGPERRTRRSVARRSAAPRRSR